MSQIVTGEAVALDLRVARIGSRLVAAMLDALVRFVAVLALLVGAGVGFSDSAAAMAFVIVMYVAVLLGYPVAFETLWGGKTPGKSAMGLRVVRDDGGPIRFRHALVRGLVFSVVELPTMFVAAIVCSLVSERGKRLGDYAAGTIVIQERVPSRTLATVPMPPPLAHWASTLDISRVDNNLAMGIRSFFERSGELAPHARDQLGHSLITAVLAVTSPPPPPDAPAWAVLAAVLAERRRRDEMRLYQQRQMVARASAAPGAPTWQGQPTQGGWGAAQPAPPWQASAPPTGAPSPVAPPSQPTPEGQSYFGPPPPIPPAPAPVPASPPVPAEPPPADGFQMPG